MIDCLTDKNKEIPKNEIDNCLDNFISVAIKKNEDDYISFVTY